MKERFKVLDIFRGIFSGMVFLFHLSPFTVTPVINNSFIANSYLFVDFFFVLSGFVLAFSYNTSFTMKQFGVFLKKRFFRIYPLHVVILIAFVVIELLKHFAAAYVHVNRLVNPENNVVTLLTNVFLVNSIKFPGVKDVSWNVASWSISAEMICYICLGFIMVGINKVKFKNLRGFVSFIFVAIAAYLLYNFTGSISLTNSFDFGFLRGIIGFFSGVICFHFYNTTKMYTGKVHQAAFTFMEVIMILLIVAMVSLAQNYKAYGLCFELLFFLTIYFFAFEKGWLSRQLKKVNLLHNMGKYSYSIYMIHPLMISLFNILFIRIIKFPPSAYSYLFIVNYLVIYYLSALTFRHIEIRFNLSQTKKEREKRVWWLW